MGTMPVSYTHLMEKIRHTTVALLLIAGIFFSANAVSDSRLMRFPDINGNLVAFVYAGDIWTVSSNGGDARRLTSHEGMELFPKISPDGKWIAFSGEYSGSRQIFVIPVSYTHLISSRLPVTF